MHVLYVCTVCATRISDRSVALTIIGIQSTARLGDYNYDDG